MNNKDITNVKKITTVDLDVNGKIDMKGNKIINVYRGSDADDAAIIQNIRDTTNFLTNFLFTTDLKHDNEKIVKFPPNLKTINDDTTGSRMTTGNTIQNYITFYTGGGALFHIIYNDFYKGGGTFKISAKIYNGDTFTLVTRRPYWI